MAAVSRHILYTPLEATYTFAPKHAVAFIGTADPWSDVPAVIQMSETQGVPMHVYENANHSLETEEIYPQTQSGLFVMVSRMFNYQTLPLLLMQHRCSHRSSLRPVFLRSRPSPSHGVAARSRGKAVNGCPSSGMSCMLLRVIPAR